MRHSVALLGLAAALMTLLPPGDARAQAPRIVENSGPLWRPGEELRLAPTPTLRIGTQPGEMYEFDRITGSARLRGGWIVVADGGSNSLRFFDSSGTFLKAVGGRGAGPGEFQNLQLFATIPGDTLIAGAFLGDLSYFTGTGEYLTRRGTMNPPMQIARLGRPITLASLDGSGGRVVAALMPPSQRGSGSRWIDSFPVAIVDGRNAEVRQLGTQPSMEMAMSGGHPRPPWFGANAIFTSDGKFFYLGFGSEYAIRVYTPQGSLKHIIRRVWTPIRLTQADIDRYVVEWGKRWITSTGAEAEAERASLRKDPYAATVPAFSQFIADRVGRLWVREAHLADAPGAGALNTTPLVPSIWSVFDPAGRWLGDVTMPARFQPGDIGADYVLGTALDGDGIQTIALYRLGT